MKKLNLNDIKKGKLVGKIHDKTVKFFNQGEECSVDIRIKQLPFAKSEPLYARLQSENDEPSENLVAEWIAQTLVDDNGDLQFTVDEVKNNFIQPLANVTFNAILGLDEVKKTAKKAEK